MYYALNTYLMTQGASAIFGATVIVSNRVPAAMMGIPICSVLLLVCSLIGMHDARGRGLGWADRVPLVGFEQIDTRSREGEIYQGTMLFILSVLPIIALIHFWILFSRADVVTTKNPPVRIASIWSWSALTSVDDPARICNILHVEAGAGGASPSLSCEGNITILPGLEPTVFAILSLAATGVTILFWSLVFLRGTNPEPNRIPS